MISIFIVKKKVRLFLLLVLSYSVVVAQEKIRDLQCNHLTNPIGLDDQHPVFTWKSFNTKFQSAFQIEFSSDSIFSKKEKIIYTTSRVKNSQNIYTYNGPSLKPFEKYYWRVKLWDEKNKMSISKISSWEMGLIDPSNWKGSWITDSHDINEKRAADFRKTIQLHSNIKSARAYISAGGLFELYANGLKVGNHRLDPMFTRYDRRIEYITFDITDLLHKGNNVLAVRLGNGWYNFQPTAVWFFDKAPWRARPKFCMDIHITYEDGSTQTIVTDNTWKTHLNEIVRNNIYTGEYHDNRLMEIGWLKSEFRDTAWRNVSYVPAPTNNIVAMENVPIRDVDTIYPKKVSKLNDSTYVFDFGQNFSGVSELNVKGFRGAHFKLVHGERLYQDGSVDISNIDYHYRPKADSDPFGTDDYILSGNGTECFRPLFNYKGFQYVQVTCPSTISLDKSNLKAYFMHSDVPPIGFVNSSNPLLNKIWKATNQSYLSNLFGYPTDCPQREKNGWTGDAHTAVETGLYNFDAYTIYKKWMYDNIDVQQPNGILPAIIPTDWWGMDWANGSDWTSTLAVIPWNLFQFYGDTSILKQCYFPLKKYIDHLNFISPNFLTDWGLGDWIPIKSVATKELVTSIYYYVDCNLLAKEAKILGMKVDAIYYHDLSEKIKNAINKKYLNYASGIYANGYQTELSMPLMWGIVPSELKAKVAANLASKVQSDKGLDVGLLGSKAILNALSENGFAEIAYQLASSDTFPSWGYWIKNGATTLYENWKITGKEDLSMNHIMFGEIGAWFYKGLGGILPDSSSAGFKHFFLKPNIIKNLQHFEARFNSPYGLIVSEWEHVGNKTQLYVEVPSNSSATLFLPKKGKDEKIELSSGKYQYEW
ncbi:MAG: alpha-rhamnosidase [Pseudopedobacter saltans]|uniref:alpha-L-rhamnosidase n=1 Tax=Pseudopedobacter saltans TaxID=151895 RepID=A0A2W5F6B6_9SPHI|nr:MAG: alpha-rhamnosidase [Pseudopedobacter saltans]